MGSRGRVGELRARRITLIVSLATLTSNVLSSLLISRIPDDPYHLATNFGRYLHFANVLSVFGFIGALRQHALSIAIFSNYLILDTILSAIPRFLLLSLLQPLSSTLCAGSSSPQYLSRSYVDTQQQSLSSPSSDGMPFFNSDNPSSTQWDSLSVYTASGTPDACLRIVFLAQVTLAAGVVAVTLLQFIGALCVREYAQCLWVRDMKDEERIVESLAGVEVRLVEVGVGASRLEVIVECSEDEEKIVG